MDTFFFSIFYLLRGRHPLRLKLYLFINKFQLISDFKRYVMIIARPIRIAVDCEAGALGQDGKTGGREDGKRIIDCCPYFIFML